MNNPPCNREPDLSKELPGSPGQRSVLEQLLPPRSAWDWPGAYPVITANLLAFAAVYLHGGASQLSAVFFWDMLFIFAAALVTMLILLPAAHYLLVLFFYLPVSALALAAFMLMMTAVGQLDATSVIDSWAATWKTLSAAPVLAGASSLFLARGLSAFRGFGAVRIACAGRGASDNFSALIKGPFTYFLPLAGCIALSLVLGALVLQNYLACYFLIALSKLWIDILTDAGTQAARN